MGAPLLSLPRSAGGAATRSRRAPRAKPGRATLRVQAPTGRSRPLHRPCTALARPVEHGSCTALVRPVDIGPYTALARLVDHGPCTALTRPLRGRVEPSQRAPVEPQPAPLGAPVQGVHLFPRDRPIPRREKEDAAGLDRQPESPRVQFRRGPSAPPAVAGAARRAWCKGTGPSGRTRTGRDDLCLDLDGSDEQAGVRVESAPGSREAGRRAPPGRPEQPPVAHGGGRSARAASRRSPEGASASDPPNSHPRSVRVGGPAPVRAPASEQCAWILSRFHSCSEWRFCP